MCTIGQRDRTREEFFHTFNALYQTGQQIVSSDCAPSGCPMLKSAPAASTAACARIEPGLRNPRGHRQGQAAMPQRPMPDEVAGYVARIDQHPRA
jgi:hypothetical protein